MRSCDRARRAVITVAAVAALTLAPRAGGPPAHAQTTPPAASATATTAGAKAAAQAHLDRGNALFRDERHREALAEFEAAFALYPSARLEFNMGQCERALGHPAAAVAHFQKFLDGAGDVAPALRAEAERYLTELRASAGTEAGDGGTPAATLVPPAAGPAPTPRVAALTAAPPPAPPLALEARPAPAPGAPPRPLTRRWWFWAALGTVTAGAALGVVLWMNGRDPSCEGLKHCY